MEITEMESSILQLNTLDEIKKHLRRYFVMLCTYMHQLRKNPCASAVMQVCNIIQNNYAENLTVQNIADLVYLTVPHICTIFKKEMGLTINDYLARTRIEKSKELLTDPRYKLYEVSQAVGYLDPAYFAKLFKKYVGCTPKEFRNLNADIL